YYQFAIENGSGSGYTIFTGYNGCNLTNNFWVPKSNNDVDVPKDLAIPRATPTPTPTPSPTATPTPRPSGELGGTVIRNDSSSFIPVPISSPSTAPTLKPLMPPTATPTPEPTSTPEPSASAPSNVYLWLVIALVAIVAIAAAALLYLRK
ncbi:MAG TPA: hypothetical protein VMC61_03855, partial [Methanocella sp.]|nr:hypothetical protein [Methanocella sp.]